MRKGFESITEFIFMNDKITKSDIILIPGCSHKQLPIAAANLFNQGYADYILPSGGVNKTLDNQTEFEYIKEILLENGVNEECILEESKAKHTFDNAFLSLEVLKTLKPKKVILVCKAYHSRRAYMTYRSIFPKDIEILVYSLAGKYDIRPDNWMNSELGINKVMGEVSKIGTYFKDKIDMMNIK